MNSREISNDMVLSNYFVIKLGFKLSSDLETIHKLFDSITFNKNLCKGVHMITLGKRVSFGENFDLFFFFFSLSVA